MSQFDIHHMNSQIFVTYFHRCMFLYRILTFQQLFSLAPPRIYVSIWRVSLKYASLRWSFYVYHLNVFQPKLAITSHLNTRPATSPVRKCCQNNARDKKNRLQIITKRWSEHARLARLFVLRAFRLLSFWMFKFNLQKYCAFSYTCKFLPIEISISTADMSHADGPECFSVCWSIGLLLLSCFKLKGP